jgi:hypothetical protein
MLEGVGLGTFATGIENVRALPLLKRPLQVAG